ncbi:hypothetical protein DM2_647 [Halorubrum sp. DM2]|uniref:hypothetical protein n=1 Tax=Halorubrum sp. DM2 TaxID=2527867 RepID=UPI0024B6B1FC|nr:hypothetical protein [Halorubrum sp. DM2]VTT87313.1 hypothetical protein DM2_647 [Halorubrum sp. DM2]
MEAAAELDPAADSDGSGTNTSDGDDGNGDDGDSDDSPDPAAICERTLAEVQTQIEATDVGQAAAVAAVEEADGTTINDHIEEYRSLVEEASATSITEPEGLSEILGF